MVDRAGRAVRERVVRSFAAIVLLPMPLSAQEACPVRVSWQAPTTIGGGVHAVVPDGRDIVLLGETILTMRRDSSGAPVVVDTNFAGMRRRASRPPELIPRPRGARAFISPRAFRLPFGAIEVIWSEPDFDAGARYGFGAWFLRSATLRRSSWSTARTLGRFSDRVTLSRQMGSDIVRSGGSWRIAFTWDDTVTYKRPLVLATHDSRGWTLRSDLLPLRSLGAVALADDRGTLVGLVTAVVVPPRAPAGVPVRQTIWRTRLVDAAWTRPEQVGGDGARPLSDPQLLTSPSGVIAAWLDRGDSTSTLEWRDITRDRELGPLQRLDGAVMMVSGLEGHRDLLSVSMLDGTGRVLRLRADGYDEVGRYPAKYGFAFPVAGPRDRPIAVVTDIAERDGHQWPTLTAYDLRCARAASGGAVPPG